MTTARTPAPTTWDNWEANGQTFRVITDTELDRFARYCLGRRRRTAVDAGCGIGDRLAQRHPLHPARPPGLPGAGHRGPIDRPHGGPETRSRAIERSSTAPYRGCPPTTTHRRGGPVERGDRGRKRCLPRPLMEYRT